MVTKDSICYAMNLLDAVRAHMSIEEGIKYGFARGLHILFPLEVVVCHSEQND